MESDISSIVCVVFVTEPKPAVTGELDKHPLWERRGTLSDDSWLQACRYHWPTSGVKKFDGVVRPILVKTTTVIHKTTY